MTTSGQPFPIFGRASWGVSGLSSSDLSIYLNDCVAKGFTAIECPMPCTPDGAASAVTIVNPNLPADASGHMPFLKQLDGTTWTTFQETYSNINTQAPDFSTPNTAFFASVDALLNACLARGLLVTWFPAYVGHGSTHEGWMDEMTANGATKMATYGTFIGNRYATQANLVWMIAGDRGTTAGSLFSPAELIVEQAFVNALLAASPHVPALLVSAEFGRDTIGFDQADLGPLMTLDPCYVSATGVNLQASRAYAYSTPVTPAFVVEDIYDNETDSGVRRQQWWALVSGLVGYQTGNDYVWPFDAAGVWKAHLNAPTTLDLQRMHGFVRSMDAMTWARRIPSFPADASPLITAGGSTISAADYVASSVAADGSWLWAYRPPAHAGTFTVRMSVMRGSTRSRWFDPTAGAYTADATGLSNSGTHVFTPPGTNVGGQTDWLLVLDA
jgi:hypothetical protein